MNKKTFDLILLTVILVKPATGVVKMAARRWSDESSGFLATIGNAIKVGL